MQTSGKSLEKMIIKEVVGFNFIYYQFQLLCNTCAEKCSQCPVCRIDIEERLQAFLPVDRDELDLKYRIITKSDRRKTF